MLEAGDPALPRVDRVVRDGGLLMVLKGTPSAGATLANPIGAPEYDRQEQEFVTNVLVAAAGAASSIELPL